MAEFLDEYTNKISKLLRHSYNQKIIYGLITLITFSSASFINFSVISIYKVKERVFNKRRLVLFLLLFLITGFLFSKV